MYKKISTLFVMAVICGLLLAACGGAPAAAPTSAPTGNLSDAPTPDSSAPTASAPAPSGSGTIVADLGFRPDVNGFNFENYGKSDNQNLTPDEIRAIYGDSVCSSTADGKCILVPAGEQWMVQQNQGMDGGHCYGFSVASLLLFQNKINPADFGGATAISLPLAGNDKLQRRIAQSFVYQGFDPVRSGAIAGTPNEVLDRLIEVLKAGINAPETYTIGFFKATGGGGHAVTPYAVEDRGNGIFAVMIYDNNYPKEARSILFDRNTNTWNYTTTTNPSEPTSEYQGTAETKSLFLFPTTPGTAVQPCPFCAGGAASGSQGAILAAAAVQYNEIYLDGDPSVHGHILITDDQGRHYGYLPDGKFVTEIPEVKSERMFTDLSSDTPEPIYFVPVGMKFTMTIDGSPLTTADETSVVLIGPGYDLGVDGINLEPGQQDTLDVSADGLHLSYKTTSSESPSLILGFDGASSDYEFEMKGVDVQGGGAINMTLDKAEGFLTLDTDGTTVVGQYSLVMNRIDDAGEQTFQHDNIELDPTDTLYIYFGNWTSNGGTLELGIDAGSTGTITDHVTLTDDN
jgi:hypothetical protein